MRHRRHDQGFSIVELSVAIVILNLLLLALIPAILSAVMMGAESRVASEANLHLQNELNVLLSDPDACVDGTSAVPWVSDTVALEAMEFRTTLTGCSTPVASVRLAIVNGPRVITELESQIAR